MSAAGTRTGVGEDKVVGKNGKSDATVGFIWCKSKSTSTSGAVHGWKGASSSLFNRDLGRFLASPFLTSALTISAGNLRTFRGTVKIENPTAPDSECRPLDFRAFVPPTRIIDGWMVRVSRFLGNGAVFRSRLPLG